jgi:dipeptidyl aminopeptidase/acylaminoacyl peptidase
MSRAAVCLAALLAAGCAGESGAVFALPASHAHDCGEGYIVYESEGDIHRMRADGSGVVRLTDGGDSSPRWSPDGTRIAFLRDGGTGQPDLWIMDADGGSAQIALPFPGLGSGAWVRLAWSPDGRYIAITRELAGFGAFPVTVYDVIDDQRSEVGLPGEDPFGEGGVTWSPESDFLLYVIHVRDEFDRLVAELRTVRPDGADDDLLCRLEGEVRGVAWSPDGRYIAVARLFNLEEQQVDPEQGAVCGVEILTPTGDSLGFVPFGGRLPADPGTTPAPGCFLDPFWSPDSGCLGVTVDQLLAVGILVLDLSTGEEARFDGARMGDWALSIGDAPPVASFTVTPPAADVGETVTFDASASTDDRGIVEYSWDFDGDGTFDAEGQVAQFSYVAAGPYEAMLRVRDAAGQTDATTRTVAVAEEPAGTFTLTISFEGGGTGAVRVIVDGQEVANCTATCRIDVPAGAAVALVPSPAAGSGFSRWEGCDQDSGLEGCSLTMDADRTVEVFFE